MRLFPEVLIVGTAATSGSGRCGNCWAKNSRKRFSAPCVPERPGSGGSSWSSHISSLISTSEPQPEDEQFRRTSPQQEPSSLAYNSPNSPVTTKICSDCGHGIILRSYRVALGLERHFGRLFFLFRGELRRSGLLSCDTHLGLQLLFGLQQLLAGLWTREHILVRDVVEK